MIAADEYKFRTQALQSGLADAGIDLAILTDPDSVTYFAGYWNYLGVEFGRPTLVLVPRSGEPAVVTPLMESEMCGNMSWIGDVRPWADGIEGEWAGTLERYLSAARYGTIGFEKRTIHPNVALRLKPMIEGSRRIDLHPITTRIRMRKSPAELAIMRAAGKVAVAMLEGARDAIGVGVPEYEVALAAIAGGARRRPCSRIRATASCLPPSTIFKSCSRGEIPAWCTGVRPPSVWRRAIRSICVSAGSRTFTITSSASTASYMWARLRTNRRRCRKQP
jgi:Xaa-Pro aminopeptidase